MPKSMDPVPDPVSFTLENGAVVITSIVDSVSKNHLITCSVGVNSCGLCGREGCFTQLKLKKNGSASINSNCTYHYSGMQYKRAAQFSNPQPCTNVPIHCPLCPNAASGDPQTTWKYNALYHLI